MQHSRINLQHSEIEFFYAPCFYLDMFGSNKEKKFEMLIIDEPSFIHMTIWFF